jgi:hypothetical protein
MVIFTLMHMTRSTSGKADNPRQPASETSRSKSQLMSILINE